MVLGGAGRGECVFGNQSPFLTAEGAEDAEQRRHRLKAKISTKKDGTVRIWFGPESKVEATKMVILFLLYHQGKYTASTESNHLGPEFLDMIESDVAFPAFALRFDPKAETTDLIERVMHARSLPQLKRILRETRSQMLGHAEMAQLPSPAGE